MPQLHAKGDQPNLLPGRGSIIQIAERPILQKPLIDLQPKTISKAPVILKPILTEKSVKHVDHADPLTKPIAKQVISETTSDHTKQAPGTEHVKC